MPSRRDDGRAIMTSVVGAEFMKQRDASTNDFNKAMHIYCDEVCFGDVWARPGLERKHRSMLCIAMLIALNKPNELRAHVVGALNNGCTVQEIQEVLYQTVVYCGLPAAVEGYRVAEEVLRTRGLIHPSPADQGEGGR